MASPLSPARRDMAPGRRTAGWRALPANEYYDRSLDYGVRLPPVPYGSYHQGTIPAYDSWSASRPAPPQNPIVAAMASQLRSDGLLSSEIEKSDAKGSPEVASVDCWRLRMCALFLVLGTAMQALVVGGQLQALANASGVTMVTIVASLCVLAAMLLALWSLLSQLLLWSDAAVFKLPQHMTLKAEVRKKKYSKLAAEESDKSSDP